MRPVRTLVRALFAGLLVADALGGGDGMASSPPPGMISGTVAFAKVFAAPPSAQHAAPAGVTRAVPPLAPKTRRAQGALLALVRPLAGRAGRGSRRASCW